MPKMIHFEEKFPFGLSFVERELNWGMTKITAIERSSRKMETEQFNY